jgi:sirohydrochlorin ferrochelatase
MKVALVDNGSLEAAAHECLRAAAAAIGERADVPVEAVSWRHSDRIPSYALPGVHAWTLAPWIREQLAAGEREFLLIPFFISPQGAIGSSLRRDLEALRGDSGGFDYSIAGGLAPDTALAPIVADRVRKAIETGGLIRPAVVVVDHGGPSGASAAVRDRTVDAARWMLGMEVSSVAAASMESPEGSEFDFNRPLLGEALSAPGIRSGAVVIAPLFLSPGRHAGPAGDLSRIARAAEAQRPGLRCHFTELVGSHPLTIEILAAALLRALRVAAIP